MAGSLPQQASTTPASRSVRGYNDRGTALGDFVRASFSLDMQGITLTARVSPVVTVSAQFQNGTAGTMGLASGTLRMRLEKA